MPAAKSAFTERVLSAYDGRKTLRASASESFAENEAQTSLPPSLQHLRLGEQASHDVASVFIDLREFTARSFWDEPAEVANLADAVLSGVAMIVEEMGGWVVGLRGDGLYAMFGIDPFISEQIAVLTAATACARALSEVRENLNPWLELRGIERVRVRAGADFGTVAFIRSGTVHASEVNPVGFSANFASKCEKYALAWEVVVGDRFARSLGDAVEHHAESPKYYTRHGETKYYHFHDFAWRRLVPALPGFAEDIRAVLSDAGR
ncbi:adenylate/guanylate cyclase family protein [Curtobacterium sp. PhB142]|uniref:adenylate/guanylate cyclase domain-containing protein n=1 Tax=unclassified Curtobacterium TaxID=257496 RepID=UPI0010F2012E|nr:MULTISPECIES: adenylate/guanylate cyclase domain-containing protein [unclassified Curtobacterium]TCL88768.1 adenylate/guanylate cyclase family protein [Curtobacterium sp. PhB142]TCM03869.1 adenylate/guanylate cyclase family protein [Curtobacterium sp. PhB134]WIE57963.1 adenylate/guanylate cyclase domain-containing protein [Curtobacterium sp. MCLR17_031]